MNTPTHPQPRCRSLIGFLLLALVLPLLAVSSLRATTYYQVTTVSGDWHVLSRWNTAADGSGSAPTAISNTDDFVANHAGWSLGGSAGTFGGKSLTVGPNTQTLSVAGLTSTVTVPNLVTLGSAMIKAGYNNSNLAVTSWLNPSSTTRIINHTNSNALFPLAIGTLTGSGNFDLTAGSATALLKLTVADATSYVGTITLISGKLEFMNAMSSGGALVVNTASDVTLNQPVIFTGLTVAGAVKTPGVYTAAALGFAGTGSVTVRTPATWYLTTSQTGAQDWTQAYKTNWTANANGTGVTAPSINIVDTYVHNVGTNLLLTPATNSSFLGGTLSLGGTAQLVLNGTGSVLSTIPRLTATGGSIIVGTTTRNLDIDTYSIASGTTTLSTGTGGVLNLYVLDFKGSGNLALSGTGQLVPFIDEGNGFTGTITVNSGARLNLTTQFATAGALVINTGGLVTINDWAYVTALTVNGVVKPVGTYTAASLGFTGAGSITVYTRDLAGPPQMFGVNLAGAEFSSGAYWPDTAATWDYYKGKGLTLIRLPFKWERIQTTINGAVNFTKLDQVVALAAARDMKVILDLHNYNNYNGNQVGTAAVPHSALANVWSQIADHFKNEPAIYGYDLMNEPGGTLENWAAAAQTTVNAIRKKDTTHYVFIEGMSYANASKWPNVSGALDIHDPAGRLIYSAHSYWDTLHAPPNYGSDGTYASSEVGTATSGVNHVAPFVQWLQTRPYAHGHIGEYGTPNDYNVASWNLALDGFLTYLKANNISGTYWAGGAWNVYQLMCEPRPLVGGADKPQMAVLAAHNNFVTWLNQDIGAVGAAGSTSISNGTFTLQGSGADLWSTADEFHYNYQPISGDCTITARVISLSPAARTLGGVMIRETLAANSSHAVTTMVDTGVNAFFRVTTGGNTTHSGTTSGLAKPYWLRLVRSGNTFNAYHSPDSGGTPSGWVQKGTTTTINMAASVYVGLAVSSRIDGTIGTGVFDNVTVTTP